MVLIAILFRPEDEETCKIYFILVGIGGFRTSGNIFPEEITSMLEEWGWDCSEMLSGKEVRKHHKKK